MAGEAKTTQFNISDATVMIGPAGKGFDLTPEEHSIGLVKDVTVTNTKERVELGQGLTNDIVDSQVIGNTTSVTMSAYEYTAKNIAYAAGVSGSEITTGAEYKIKDAVTGGQGSNSVSVVSDSDVSALFPAGKYIVLQAKYSGASDRVCISKVASSVYTAPEAGSSASGTVEVVMQPEAGDVLRIGTNGLVAGTDFQIGADEAGTAANIAALSLEGIELSVEDTVVTVKATAQGLAGNAITLYTDNSSAFTLSGATLTGGTEPTAHGYLKITTENDIPSGFSFVAGDSVNTVTLINVASNEETPYVSVKIVQILPNGKDPVVLIINKARITNGFSLAATSTDYAAMPWEITPYSLLPSDEGYDSKNKGRILVFKK